MSHQPDWKAAETPTSGRVHYLDALRAFVMCIGIFVHAALWADISTGVPGAISVVSHLFRMKLFIFLGGYFVALQIPKRGTSYIVRDRLRRLGIPILVFLLIFNPLTIYIWNLEQLNYPPFFYYVINMPTPELQTHGAGWHLHIWFLIVLLGHCLSLPTINALLIQPKIVSMTDAVSDTHPKFTIFILAVGTSFLFLLGRIVHFLTFQQILHGGPFNYLAQAYLTYLPFFMLGIVAFRNERLFRAMHKIPLLQIAAAVAIWWVVMDNYDYVLSSFGRIFSDSLKHFSQELLGFYIACALLKGFSSFASTPGRVARAFSDSSYTVYLFHMIIIVCIQWCVLQYTSEKMALYLVSVPLSFVICLSIHRFIVQKSAIMAYLLNGRALPKATAANTHS